MTAFFSRDVNPVETTEDDQVITKGGRKVLNDSLALIILDSQHQYDAASMCKTGERLWPAVHL